jgi:speckle-type POZ protein
MAQNLLVAADRYGIDRLRLICEDKLCGYVDARNVGTILALAEQHHCNGLKRACFKFLMSGNNLKAAVATTGFEHLSNSCPSVLKELLAKASTLLPD